MVALYLVSVGEAAGKTTIGAGLGKHMLDDGKKVGFLKPIIAEKKPSGSDSDAAFLKQILGLPEPVEALCPLVGNGKSLADKVREAYIEVSQNKDVVIIEGRCGPGPEDNLSRASYEVAEALKAKVIVVADYARESPATKFVNTYRGFGQNLLGVIWNKVPAKHLKRVSSEVTSEFEAVGIKVLGVVPEDRILFTLTVGELTNTIQGEILNHAEKSAELVESLMVGAMPVDSGLGYFSRRANKAAVVRGDRPDLQMAALETSTRCLVISGHKAPIDYVRQKAEEKNVPVILAKSDTIAIVNSVEEAMGRARFQQEKKLTRLAEILARRVNFPAIYQGLGLAK